MPNGTYGGVRGRNSHPLDGIPPTRFLELSSQTQQSGIIDLKGFPVPQTFARSFIQFVEDGLYVFLSDISQILPFGKVFP